MNVPTRWSASTPSDRSALARRRQSRPTSPYVERRAPSAVQVMTSAAEWTFVPYSRICEISRGTSCIVLFMAGLCHDCLPRTRVRAAGAMRARPATGPRRACRSRDVSPASSARARQAALPRSRTSAARPSPPAASAWDADVADLLSEGVVVHGADGRVERVNRAAAELLADDDLLGRPGLD